MVIHADRFPIKKILAITEDGTLIFDFPRNSPLSNSEISLDDELQINGVAGKESIDDNETNIGKIDVFSGFFAALKDISQDAVGRYPRVFVLDDLKFDIIHNPEKEFFLIGMSKSTNESSVQIYVWDILEKMAFRFAKMFANLLPYRPDIDVEVFYKFQEVALDFVRLNFPLNVTFVPDAEYFYNRDEVENENEETIVYGVGEIIEIIKKKYEGDFVVIDAQDGQDQGARIFFFGNIPKLFVDNWFKTEILPFVVARDYFEIDDLDEYAENLFIKEYFDKDHLIQRCARCGEVRYKGSTILCANCKIPLCADDICPIPCSKCSKKVCPSCTFSCTTCHKNFCNECTPRNDSRKYCPDCGQEIHNIEEMEDS